MWMNFRCFPAGVCSTVGKEPFSELWCELTKRIFWHFHLNAPTLCCCQIVGRLRKPLLRAPVKSNQLCLPKAMVEAHSGTSLFPRHRSPVSLGALPWEPSKTSTAEGIGGSVVEFSPPTRETRVRFPANARCRPPLSRSSSSALFLPAAHSKSNYLVVLAARRTKMRTKILKVVLSRRQAGEDF